MRLVTLLVGSVLVLSVATPGFADDMMCKRVNKMLGMGRSVEDIVTTSAGTITEEDVEGCKAATPADAGGATPPAAGEAKPAE
jgi:hypothetical protein